MGRARTPVAHAEADHWYGVMVRGADKRMQRLRGCCVRSDAREAVLRMPAGDGLWPFPKEVTWPLARLYPVARPRVEPET